MDSLSDEDRLWSRNLLKRECDHLLSEISRLEMGRVMQDRRLKNVMNLVCAVFQRPSTLSARDCDILIATVQVFSSVNIQDSKRMQRLTEAAVRDSAAMKQIAYLSMIFLPAGFVAVCMHYFPASTSTVDRSPLSRPCSV
jgi:hypothetical protein